jgi:peptidoglycan/LPS O-acetylase OafA/YrhL
MIIKLDITQLYKLAAYFLAGSLLTYLDLKKYNTAINRSVLFAILVLSLIFNCFKEVALFALPIFILFVANISTPFISTISKKILRGADLSYGIYIYGFLIQQTLVYFYHLDTWALTFTSLIISAILAHFSWNLIEKRMTKFKNLF